MPEVCLHLFVHDPQIHMRDSSVFFLIFIMHNRAPMVLGACNPMVCPIHVCRQEGCHRGQDRLSHCADRGLGKFRHFWTLFFLLSSTNAVAKVAESVVYVMLLDIPS